MPTKREREYYRMGFSDGMRNARDPQEFPLAYGVIPKSEQTGGRIIPSLPASYERKTFGKPKRKLSAWNKYVKANSKKPRFRYRNGKLNLKKMAIAFRKTPAGRKKKRR